MTDVARDILAATQAHLRAGLSGLRDVDVFISPHEDWVPNGCQFPAVGIKDGAISYVDLESQGRRTEMEMSLAVLHQILSGPEAGLMGTPTTPGLFQNCEAVRGLMHWAKLPVDGLIECRVTAETPSALLDMGRLNIQSKIIRVRASVWRMEG